jgi:hypothetical protein
MEKTIRFGDLVRNAGRPQSIALWTAPEEDHSFMRAIRQNRVLTVVQQHTTKHKDFGLIGFHREPGASYLVFPRSLPADLGQASRVIGINYQLLAEAEEPARVSAAPATSQSPRPEPKPVKRAFTVIIRRTARIETQIRVEARSRNAAKTEALHQARALPLDLMKAVISEDVVGVK